MASIRKRTLSSGKSVWQVDYRDGAQKRRHRQFPTKREADSFCVKARAEVAAGTHTADSSSITLAAAAELWLARCQQNELETTTLRQYRAHVDLHIVPYIGALRLARVSASSPPYLLASAGPSCAASNGKT
jgi:integrase